MGNPARARLGALMVAGLAALGGGCQGTAPARDIGPPDISKISVFYPIDGLVPGRGGAGTFADPSISTVVVTAHPTGTETLLPIEQDGSFDFLVLALSDDVLEIAGARDSEAKQRGEPAYIRVPPRAPAYRHYSCCGAVPARGTTPAVPGTCTSDDQFEQTNTCADPQTGATRCDDILACRDLNHEILPIRLDRIQVTPPDSRGQITVTGSIDSGGALVRLENRGQRAIGGRNPGIHISHVSDTSGLFKFRIAARGDDELVLQVFDLIGNKSPQASVLVPDAPLAGFDLVGAYPFEPLANGKVGPVAVRMHPYGVDGRGICPDSGVDPVLCFTGGLTHAMVHIDSVTLDDLPLDPPPRATERTLLRPNNRATEGDPTSITQNIIVVIDNSDTAAMRDTTPPSRFDAAAQFVRNMRKRDKVGIISIGSSIITELKPAESGGDWGAQLAAISAAAARPADGETTLFVAIKEAAKLLQGEKSPLPGNIVVITMGDDTGDADTVSAQFDEAYDRVAPNRETGFRGYGVNIVGVAIPPASTINGVTTGHLPELESIADFSPDGRLVNVASVTDLPDALGRMAGRIAGSYVLLYDMAIPESAGKSARLKLTATVTLSSQSGAQETATATYEGPLRIDGSDQ